VRIPSDENAIEQHGRAQAGADAAAGGPLGARRRVLIVSHPAIVSLNQEVYRELADRGWEVTIVLPSRWTNSYSDSDLRPVPLAGLEHALRPIRVVLAGRPQRHFYLAAAGALVRRAQADVGFVEEEPFALAAAQWGFAFARLGIPFGVQRAENIDRSFPLPVRWLRSRLLSRAAFVAARSETAARLARAWGARGEVQFAPHTVPDWPASGAAPVEPPFTVGYAGRLVESKGVMDLLAAVRELSAPVELLLIGEGPLRGLLEDQPIPGTSARVLSGVAHTGMPSAYEQIDVLVLPSRTTPTWKEQFGRVDRRGAVVRRPRRRVGLGRDTVADRLDRRRADVSRGRLARARRAALAAEGGSRAPGSARGGGPKRGGAAVLGARGDRPARAAAGGGGRFPRR
jgi:hypothetical protein